MVAGDGEQARVTSQSASVLSRVEPVEVRYCRCDSEDRETIVKAVELPDDTTEAAKFVRGALLAFPELYFARFVLLVEGDSERIVLASITSAAYAGWRLMTTPGAPAPLKT